MGLKKRKNIRLSRALYEDKEQVFSITICTAAKRQDLFINSNLARQVINTFDSDFISNRLDLFAYCLMPDHIHLLVAPKEGNLIDIIGSWKKFTGSLMRKTGLKGPFWQRGFYDHALRSEEDLVTTAEYMVMNPVRSGLVDVWEEYPYSWHKWT
jgi:REP element-mobilizing transposase RayT